MDKEQRTAFLLAQIACFYAEFEAMKAANIYERAVARRDVYEAEHFAALPDRFGLGPNQAISFLLGE